MANSLHQILTLWMKHRFQPKRFLRVEPSTSMIDMDVENTDNVAVADVHRMLMNPPGKVAKTVNKGTKPKCSVKSTKFPLQEPADVPYQS